MYVCVYIYVFMCACTTYTYLCVSDSVCVCCVSVYCVLVCTCVSELWELYVREGADGWAVDYWDISGPHPPLAGGKPTKIPACVVSTSHLQHARHSIGCALDGISTYSRIIKLQV